jgi:hypothetical protein
VGIAQWGLANWRQKGSAKKRVISEVVQWRHC